MGVIRERPTTEREAVMRFFNNHRWPENWPYAHFDPRWQTFSIKNQHDDKLTFHFARDGKLEAIEYAPCGKYFRQQYRPERKQAAKMAAKKVREASDAAEENAQ